MSAGQEIGTRRRRAGRLPRRAGGKRTPGNGGRSPEENPPRASAHPVHCPTCGRTHGAGGHETWFASHFRSGRPGPEC